MHKPPQFTLLHRMLSLAIIVGLDCCASLAAEPEKAKPEKIEQFDGFRAAFPPEPIAALFDEIISQHPAGASLDLVPHVHPSTQPKEQQAVWVASSRGRPLSYLSQPNGKQAEDGPTARAIKRARTYLAEHFETRKLNDSRPKDWRPDNKSLRAAHQANNYGIQIIHLELVDAKQDKWKITAAPVKAGILGGEIWMTFDSAHPQVSAEFGK